jgi:hypothetical protein
MSIKLDLTTINIQPDNMLLFCLLKKRLAAPGFLYGSEKFPRIYPLSRFPLGNCLSRLHPWLRSEWGYFLS